MTDFDDRYTARARRALTFAGQEALRARQAEITPLHLLLGLLREGSGLAPIVLSNLGVDLAELRAAVEAELPRGEEPVRGHVHPSAETEEVLRLAAEQARRMKHHYLGQEHLLLGLLRQESSAVVDTLAGYFVTYDLARGEVETVLSGAIPATGSGQVKRYNLALPEELFREVERLAEREHTTVLEILRRSVKLGLLAARIQEQPDAALIIREGDHEQRLLML